VASRKKKAPARYGKNPYLTNARDVERATKLFRDFREQAPTRGRVIEFEMPKVVMIMGNVTAIEYDTTRRGKVEKYRHAFNPGSKPLLCADGETGQLFILEGRYHVTPRGIVDLDSNGKELE
jgi:ribosomal protein L2